MPLQALCIISYPSVNSNLSYSPEPPNLGQIRRFLIAVWPWNLMDDLGKQKGTSCMLLQVLCSILYSLLNSNWSYSPETPNLGQIWRFLEPCDLEIWRMTLHNNRAPLLCPSSFVYHFILIGEFKFELQSGNAQFGSKLMIFFSRVT